MTYNNKNNNLYCFSNVDFQPTVLELKTTDTSIKIELPWDCTSEQLINAFYSATIGITFQSDDILTSMIDFAKEKLEASNNEHNIEL